MTAVRWRHLPPLALTVGLSGIATFVLLGWGQVWQRLAEWAPVLSAEVYPWRFLPLAGAFAAVIYCLSVESVMKEYRSTNVQLAIVGLSLPVLLECCEVSQYYIGLVP